MKRTYIYSLLFLFISLAGFQKSSAQKISTYAGIYLGIGATGDGSAATMAEIGGPSSICLDIAGNVYISDMNNHVVRKVNTAGFISTVAGTISTSGYSGDSGAATAATLFSPMGICVDNIGNLYIADFGNACVRKVDTAGIITTVAGVGGATGFTGTGSAATSTTLDGAIGVAVKSDGTLLIADNTSRVLSVDATGILNVLAGGTTGYAGDGGMATDAALAQPVDIDIDRVGNIYIADYRNNVIRKVNTSGQISTVAGYVDTTTLAGGYTGDYGSATMALLNGPGGISVDTGGNMYIADQNNNVIRKVESSTGRIYTYAGNGRLGYTVDGGYAMDASFSITYDCAISRSGMLFFIDQQNNLVRTVSTPPAKITTPTLNVCSESPVSVTVIPAVAAALTYRWNIGGTWSFGDTATLRIDSLHNGDTVYCYILEASTGDTIGISNKLVFDVQTSRHPSVVVTGSSVHDTVCSGTMIELNAAVTDAGDSVSMLWYKNGYSTDDTTANIRFNPLDGAFYFLKVISNAVCALPRAIVSDTFTYRVLRNGPPEIRIFTISDSVCEGSRVVFNAITTNGGDGPSYQWFDRATAIGTSSSILSYVPSSGSLISCRLISNYQCRTIDTVVSNVINITTVSHLTPRIAISASVPDTLCSGTSVIYRSSIANGGATPSYNWLVNGTSVGTADTLSYSPSDGDVIRCVLHTSLACVTSDTAVSDSIKMTVISVTTPSITTSASADTVCSGSLISFSASATDAGGAPSFDWYRNGIHIAVGPTYSYRPTTHDSVFCVVHSTERCASPDTSVSAVSHVYVRALVYPTITASASSDTICAGTSVTFSSTSTNTGSAPTYLWFKNGIGVYPASSFSIGSLADSDVLYVRMVSSALCATPDTVYSDTIRMHVIPLVYPSISIRVTPNDTVCAGTTVTFNQTSANGGTHPTYTWKKNGVAVSTDTAYSYIPTDRDEILCHMTASAACSVPDTLNSNTITMTVLPNVTPSIIVTPSPSGAVCAGTTVNFTTAIINGGSAPTYQWKVNRVNVGSGATSYSYTPNDGDSVICVLNSNASCLIVDSAVSRGIRETVNPIVTPSVRITYSPTDTVCAGGAINFFATVTNGGSAPYYNWYKNGRIVGHLGSYVDTPRAGDSIYCQIASNAPCRTIDTVRSNAVYPVVIPVVHPSITISATADTVCDGTRVNYHATIVNGGTDPVFHWKINVGYVGTDTSFYSYVPRNLDRIWCILISNAQCVSPDSINSDTILMNVKPIIAPAVTILNPDTVCAGTMVTFTAVPDSGGLHPTYLWQVNGINRDTTRAISFVPTSTDYIVVRMISSEMCAVPDSAFAIANIVVDSVMTPTATITASPGTHVLHGTSITFTATTTYGGTSPTYQWYVNGTPIVGATNSTFTIDTPADGQKVYCIVLSNYNCVTGRLATSNTDTVVIIVGVPVVGISGNTLKVAPNPTRGNLQLFGIVDDERVKDVAVTITDVLGKTVLTTTEQVYNRELNTSIKLDDTLPNGVYMVKVQLGAKNEIFQVMLSR